MRTMTEEQTAAQRVLDRMQAAAASDLSQIELNALLTEELAALPADVRAQYYRLSYARTLAEMRRIRDEAAELLAAEDADPTLPDDYRAQLAEMVRLADWGLREAGESVGEEV